MNRPILPINTLIKVNDQSLITVEASGAIDCGNCWFREKSCGQSIGIFFTCTKGLDDIDYITINNVELFDL